MFGNRKDPGPLVDPLVAPIEALLSRRAAPIGMRELQLGGRLEVRAAVAVCACFSDEDAPLWVIYESMDGALAWYRKLGRGRSFDLLTARSTAGGHANPKDVLAWLRGEVSDPWAGGDGWGDEGVIERLGDKLRR